MTSITATAHTTNSSAIPFTKMHGIGNDFVLIDVSQLANRDPSQLARELCDRRFGVGSDGLISVGRMPNGVFEMRMWNPDGSESEMCGNGIRCFAKYVRDNGMSSDVLIPVQTGAGVLTLQIESDGRVRVDMGTAKRVPSDIGMSPDFQGDIFLDEPLEFAEATLVGTAVSMGNPHLVIFVEDVSAVPLAKWGPILENYHLFPARVNVHFAQVVSDDRIRMRTWERGAGVTLACGTGACAVAVAGFSTSRTDRKATLELPGGELDITYEVDGRVYMTGPAETVFIGDWPTNSG